MLLGTAAGQAWGAAATLRGGHHKQGSGAEDNTHVCCPLRGNPTGDHGTPGPWLDHGFAETRAGGAGRHVFGAEKETSSAGDVCGAKLLAGAVCGFMLMGMLLAGRMQEC